MPVPVPESATPHSVPFERPGFLARANARDQAEVARYTQVVADKLGDFVTIPERTRFAVHGQGREAFRATTACVFFGRRFHGWPAGGSVLKSSDSSGEPASASRVPAPARRAPSAGDYGPTPGSYVAALPGDDTNSELDGIRQPSYSGNGINGGGV